MKKLAIFTEGNTELLFAEAVINDLASQKKFVINTHNIMGSKRNRNLIDITEITAKKVDDNTNFYIMIYNSGTDNQVKSDLIEHYKGLEKAGYQKIIAMRDVYNDATRDELDRFRAGLNSNLPTGDIRIYFCLGVMEFEAWLLAEYTHFNKFNKGITLEKVHAECKIDLVNDDLSLLPNPSNSLKEIYWLANIHYNKNHKQLSEIFSCLDFYRIQSALCEKFEDLKRFYQELKGFFDL